MFNFETLQKNTILHNIEKSGNSNSGRHKDLDQSREDLNNTEILAKMLFSIDNVEKIINDLKHKNSHIKNYVMPLHNNRFTIGYQNLEKDMLKNLKKIKQLEVDLDNKKKEFNIKNSRWAKK